MNAQARAGKRKASDEGLLLSAAQNSGGAVRGANDTPCVLLDANKREAEPALKECAERQRKKAADTIATQKAAVKDAGLQFCSGSDNYNKSRSDGEFDVASKEENDSEDVEQENEPPQQSKVSAKTSMTIKPALSEV